MDITVNVKGAQPPIAPEDSPPRQNVPGSTPTPGEDRQSLSSVDEQALIAQIREYVSDSSISLSFSTYGEKENKISVTVKDKETGEVIREIPAEEIQKLSDRLAEVMGMFFDGTV